MKDFHAAKLKEIIHYIYTLIHIVRCRLVCAGLNLNKHNTNSSITLLFATIYESAWHALRTVICAGLFTDLFDNLHVHAKKLIYIIILHLQSNAQRADAFKLFASSQRRVDLNSTLRLLNVNVTFTQCQRCVGVLSAQRFASCSIR